MDYNVRFYDSYITHFNQPDTIIPNEYDPQTLNRYEYALDNPIRYNDPTGHRNCEEDGYDCGGGVTPPAKPDLCQIDPGLAMCGPLPPDIPINPTTPAKSKDEPAYLSVSAGLDAPTVLMLLGYGLSFVDPEVGVPLGLTGAVIEACAFTATVPCAVLKLLSFGASGTYDTNGNLYLGPQISWGKSVFPVVAVSEYFGGIPSVSPKDISEAELRDTLSGFSVSAGTIATGGISYSPFASKYHITYYFDGFPELGSVNLNLNFWIHDFKP